MRRLHVAFVIVAFVAWTGPSLSHEVAFIRGDVDGSGALSPASPVNLTDAVFLLRHLFLDGPPPVPFPESADTNDDDRINLTDAIHILEHLFRGGPPPAPPFPRVGTDPDASPCGLGLHFHRAPYIQNLAPNGALIRFELSCPGSSTLAIASQRGAFDRTLTTESDADGTFQFHLTGLEPDTEYRYRVIAEGRAVRPRDASFADLRFRTPADGKGPVTLLHWADGLSAEFVAAIYREPADLGIVAGDVVYQVERRSTYEEFFSLLAPFVASRPLYVAWGNHDVRRGNEEPFRRSFVFPEPGCAGADDPACGTYYSFDHGNAHFAVLNTSVTATGLGTNRGDLTPEQADWLEDDLSRSDARWKFIVTHHPPYTGESLWDSQLAVRTALEDAYTVAPFDFVLAGHNHVLYRSKPVLGGRVVDEGESDYVDPPGYIVVISGRLGKRAYDYRGDPAFGGWGTNAPGVFHAHMDDERFLGRFLAPSGETLHEFTVRKGGR